MIEVLDLPAALDDTPKNTTLEKPWYVYSTTIGRLAKPYHSLWSVKIRDMLRSLLSNLFVPHWISNSLTNKSEQRPRLNHFPSRRLRRSSTILPSLRSSRSVPARNKTRFSKKMTRDVIRRLDDRQNPTMIWTEYRQFQISRPSLLCAPPSKGLYLRKADLFKPWSLQTRPRLGIQGILRGRGLGLIPRMASQTGYV
jgi:hypothetical protein